MGSAYSEIYFLVNLMPLFFINGNPRSTPLGGATVQRRCLPTAIKQREEEEEDDEERGKKSTRR